MHAFKKTVSVFAVMALLNPGSLAFAETFQEALISVYNGNPRLQAERARVREVDESYIQARAQGRLTATASGSYGTTTTRTAGIGVFGSEGDSYVNGDPKAAQLQIIQPLYQGGRVKALKRQAKSSILAAREGLRDAEQNLFLSAANAYINVLRDEEAARIRRNNVMVLSRQQLAAKARFDVGEGTKTDIAQAQSRQAAAEARLAQTEAQLQASRATYARIVGHKPVDLQPVPKFELPRSLQIAMGLARENNPQILAAYFNQEAANSAVDVARSASRPVLSLNGTAGVTRDQVLNISEADQASLTAQISIPIFSGGLNKSRVRQAKHAKTRLAFEARDTELAVDQTVAQIWAQIEAARLSLRASRQQVAAAEVAFEGVDLEQQAGFRTTLDVLDAEQEVLNAKLSVIESERNINAATFELLRTLGVFDVEGIRLPVEAYDPSQNFETVKSDGMTVLTDRYVPDFIQEAVDEIIEIPEKVGKAAVNLVKPKVISDAVASDGSSPSPLLSEATLDSPIDSNKKRPDLISPKN